ncbi:hypothetical protein HN858_01075 [Candidatus Falkowbacteria bacterium]|jgi:hypothetical protein|nr:hypothetical protein [Candidatus Falkowbacteria bacterium]MBT6574302.1 hypothetical protein [Candidatus Falkowbacteria bacterium]MBT7348247.1 hypothetical protein [Candidatus Falkowbacteria bacterium]MBT7500226.1 hypothetical protein [Candidatus Falkowbacteria bacterium]
MSRWLKTIITVIIIIFACSCNKDKKAKKNKSTRPEVAEKNSPNSNTEPAPLSQEKEAPPKSKKEISEEKLEHVKHLRRKLERKERTLAGALITYKDKISIFVQEIKQERNRRNLVEYNQAISSNSIKHNLEAIQKAEAYWGITNREKVKTKLAIVDAEGTEKLLDLDITMFSTMPEDEIDKLLDELDLVINRIQPTARDLVITDKETVLTPLDEIYEKHIRKEEREREKKEIERKKKAEADRLERERQVKLAKEKALADTQARAALNAEARRQALIARKQADEEAASQERTARLQAIAEATRQAKIARQQITAEENRIADEVVKQIEYKKREAENRAREKAAELASKQKTAAAIANIKIIKPTIWTSIAYYRPGGDGAGYIRWSNDSKAVAITTSSKMTIKGVPQSTTYELESNYDNSDYITDMIWSQSKTKIAIYYSHSCALERGNAKIAIYSLTNDKELWRVEVECSQAASFLGWFGDYIVLKASAGYSRNFHIYIINTKTKKTQSFTADAITPVNNSSVFAASSKRIIQVSLSDRTILKEFKFCRDDDESLYYSFCPGEIDIHKLAYTSGHLISSESPQNGESSFSIWDTTSGNKLHWFKGDEPRDLWWLKDGKTAVIALSSGTIFTVNAKSGSIYEKKLVDGAIGFYGYNVNTWSTKKPHLVINKNSPQHETALNEKAGSYNTLFVMDIRDQQTKAVLVMESDISDSVRLSWSPNGKYLAIGDKGLLHVFNVSNI